MKTTQYILLLVFLLGGTSVSAQTFIDDSKVWSILATTRYYNVERQWMRTTILKFSEDTVINGKVYRKLYESQNEDRQNWKFKTLFRETMDNKVYHREPYSGRETLIYDFALQENDTFEIYEGLILIVDSIRIKKWGEKERKIWYLKAPIYEFLPQTIWVEGVGQLGHFMWSTEVEIQGARRELLCFEEDDQQVYQNPQYNKCYILDTTSTQIKDKGKIRPPFKLFPNPASKKLHLRSDLQNISGISLLDIHGQIIHKFNSDKRELDISGIPKGLYFLVIESDDRKLTRKVIIH